MKALNVLLATVAVVSLTAPVYGSDDWCDPNDVLCRPPWMTPILWNAEAPVASNDGSYEAWEPDSLEFDQVYRSYYWRVDDVNLAPVEVPLGQIAPGTTNTAVISVTNLHAEPLNVSLTGAFDADILGLIEPGRTINIQIPCSSIDLEVRCNFNLTLSVCGQAVLTAAGRVVPSAQWYIEAVIARLEQLLADHPTAAADKIEDVLAKLLNAHFALTKDPPDHQAAAGNVKGAVGDLEAALKDGLLDIAQGLRQMDVLTYATRMLATDAIDAAVAAGADPEKMAEAGEYLILGDEYWINLAFKDAVDSYKNVLASAKSAASNPIDPLTGNVSAWFVVAAVQTAGTSTMEGDEGVVWVVGQGRKGPEATNVTPCGY